MSKCQLADVHIIGAYMFIELNRSKVFSVVDIAPMNACIAFGLSNAQSYPYHVLMQGLPVFVRLGISKQCLNYKVCWLRFVQVNKIFFFLPADMLDFALNFQYLEVRARPTGSPPFASRTAAAATLKTHMRTG